MFKRFLIETWMIIPLGKSLVSGIYLKSVCATAITPLARATFRVANYYHGWPCKFKQICLEYPSCLENVRIKVSIKGIRTYQNIYKCAIVYVTYILPKGNHPFLINLITWGKTTTFTKKKWGRAWCPYDNTIEILGEFDPKNVAGERLF